MVNGIEAGQENSVRHLPNIRSTKWSKVEIVKTGLTKHVITRTLQVQLNLAVTYQLSYNKL